MSEVKTLGYFINGKSGKSKAKQFYEIPDPNTGEIIAKAPFCTKDEVNKAVKAAKNAFPDWRDTPVIKRVQILCRFKRILEDNIDDLTMMVCRENGKVWEEAKGDVLKAIEVVELACGAPNLMMGESLMDTSRGQPESPGPAQPTGKHTKTLECDVEITAEIVLSLIIERERDVPPE